MKIEKFHMIRWFQDVPKRYKSSRTHNDFEMALFRSGADFVAIYQIEFRHTFLKSGKRLAKGSLFGIADSP